MYANFLIFLLFSYYCYNITNAQDVANYMVRKAYFCEDVPKQTINLTVVLKTFTPGAQLVDIHWITPIPIGNQVKFSIGIETEITLAGKSLWQHLFSFEDDFCRAIQMYLGEMMYEFEQAVGIPRGTCPIPKGRYHAMNYTLDYSKSKIQSFPLGRFRTTFQFLEKPARNILHCSKYIASN